MIDLHTHTSHSDGTLTPSELVKLAVQKGIRYLAISDHDNVSGIDEAIEAAKDYTIEIIPAVELSADVPGDEVHILGYFIDYKAEEFAHALVKLRKSRRNRVLEIIDKLNDIGINISADEVFGETRGDSVGRPHIARVLVKKGYISSIQKAFEQYLGKDSPCYVPRKKLTPQEAVLMIKSAGGIPVVAHPGLIGNFSGIFPSLLSAGLMGVEVYHTEHTPQMTDFHLKNAIKHNLLFTAGSDFHDPQRTPVLGMPFAPGDKIMGSLFKLKKG